MVSNFQLVPEVDDMGNTRIHAERVSIARDKTMASTLIRGADPTRFGTLICHLANQFANGMDEYPEDFGAAHSLLESYSSPSNTRPRVPQQQATHAHAMSVAAPASEASAMTFAQQAAVPGTDGVTHEGITCYNCRSMGHYSDDCPQARTSSGTTLFQYAYMMAQSNDAGIDPNWILLDSQSTISVFRNRSMLSNIRRSPHTLRALRTEVIKTPT